MKMTFGAFKEVYRNQGIYWDGTYNIEGSGQWRTLDECRRAVDRHIDAVEREEKRLLSEQIASGSVLVAKRLPDDSVTIKTPTGEVKFDTMRKARQNVFLLMDHYGMDLVWE